jgi:hypothetical protein
MNHHIIYSTAILQTYRPKSMDSHDDDEGKRAKRKELKEDA